MRIICHLPLHFRNKKCVNSDGSSSSSSSTSEPELGEFGDKCRKEEDCEDGLRCCGFPFAKKCRECCMNRHCAGNQKCKYDRMPLMTFTNVFIELGITNVWIKRRGSLDQENCLTLERNVGSNLTARKESVVAFHGLENATSAAL